MLKSRTKDDLIIIEEPLGIHTWWLLVNGSNYGVSVFRSNELVAAILYYKDKGFIN
jgi:hypothetical protein